MYHSPYLTLTNTYLTMFAHEINCTPSTACPYRYDIWQEYKPIDDSVNAKCGTILIEAIQVGKEQNIVEALHTHSYHKHTLYAAIAPFKVGTGSTLYLPCAA